MKTTFKQEVVHQLLHWLEGNIHTPLTINDFVEKSGYSKWHLQRIFKEVTGQKLASYCRQRRLTSSAVMLRLFDKQIDSVGSEHGFSSHNVYHKTFKRHFNVTPAQYRDALHWSCKGLCPPINLSEMVVPEGKLVELDAMTLQGRVTDYAFTLDTICHFCWDQRAILWRQRLAAAAAKPTALYGLTNVIKGGPRADDCATLQYLACFNSDAAAGEDSLVQVELEKQTYLHFTFNGDVQQFADFIKLIYEHALPTAGAVRRDGYDIERIDPQRFSGSGTGCIDYYVPVLV
ncbi:helix-turn-helix domain-containing protein [Pseudomonas graminis]